MRDEIALTPPCDRSGEPADPLRIRDRVRATATADQAPPQSERARSAQDPATAPRLARPSGPHSLSRPSTAHSPAALQVFRC
ncbi:hypothetical protein ACFWNK_22770 [Streptomyces sp. NPDC058417]|uniref:hypothetical protein n=1 Tax=unclassified Streptomyces TaxID=2593676 RepID=UPI003665413E